MSSNKLQNLNTHVYSDLLSWTNITVRENSYRNVTRSVCCSSSQVSESCCWSGMNDGKNQPSFYSPHKKFESDLEDTRIGIWEFNQAANNVVRHNLRH